MKKADPERLPASLFRVSEMPMGIRSAAFIWPAKAPPTDVRVPLNVPVSPLVQPPAGAVYVPLTELPSLATVPVRPTA